MVGEGNKNFTFRLFKGAHIGAVLSSIDANAIVNHPVAKVYYDWLKAMKSNTEEHYMATLLRFPLNGTKVSCFFVDTSILDILFD